MKRKTLSGIIMSCILSVGLLGGCKKRADITETTTLQPSNASKDAVAGQVIATAETSVKSIEGAVSNSNNMKEEATTFDYTIRYNEATINCNIPNGWLLDHENTTNAQLTAYYTSNDQQLQLSGATDQKRGWFDNYHANGEWADEIWEIKLDDFSEVETPYGRAEVVTGISAINGFKYHLCLLYYNSAYWYIEERSTASEVDEKQSVENIYIKELLNDLFTGKSLSDVEIPAPDTYIEDYINLSFQENEYEYYIEKPDWGKEGTPIINILGFNLPEGFDEVKESEAFSDDIVWKRAYTLEKSTSMHSGFLDRIVISLASSGTYLQDYNRTDQFMEGVKYRNQYKVISVEKKDVIDTIYGKLQIFYQVVEDVGTEEQKDMETTVCYVNGEIITIDLLSKFYSEELKGYSGDLKDYLTQMFTNQ